MRPLTCIDFIGRWSITRQIEDDLSHSVKRFLGDAEIRPEGQNFIYQEQGHLKIDTDKSIFASQSYIWTPKGTSFFDIMFKDGRYFHSLDLRTDCGASIYKTEHLCGSDLYEVQYNFEQFPI